MSKNIHSTEAQEVKSAQERPLICSAGPCVIANIREKIINTLFITVEETETKSTLQIRGEAPRLRDGRGREGKETFGIKYCHLSGAADESQEIRRVRTDNLPLQFYTPAPNKSRSVRRDGGWRACEEGRRFPFHLMASQCRV